MRQGRSHYALWVLLPLERVYTQCAGRHVYTVQQTIITVKDSLK